MPDTVRNDPGSTILFLLKPEIDMNIAIICGSQQKESQSSKVAHFLSERLTQLNTNNESWVLDLAAQPLELWDPSIWQAAPKWVEVLSPLSQQLKKSDGFIIIAPEYHGMVPAALKNFFLMWGNGELAHKPALLCGVSSGIGGAYPIAELRMSSYKNNRISYMPEHLIIRQVEEVFNSELGDSDDETLRQRADYALNLLVEYSKAYQGIRNSGLIDLKTWRNGM